MKTLNQLTAGLESFDEGADVAFDHTDVLDSGLGGENAVMDKALEEVIDVLEGAETDVTSLESLKLAIDEAREIGMEAFSAQFARIQLQGICQRYDAAPVETPFPSMESFHGGQRRLATSVSMEAVNETIQKVMAWVKERLYKVLEMIKHYWARLIRSLDYIESEAKKIRQAASRGTWSGGKDITLPPTVAARLAHGKIVPQQYNGLVSELRKIRDLNKVSAQTLDTIRERVNAQLAYQLRGGQEFAYKAEAMIPQGWTEVHLGGSGATYSHGGTARTFVSPTLPGNVEIAITVYGEANQALAKNDETGSWYVAKPEIRKLSSGDVDTTARALSSSEVMGLCEEIRQIVSSLKDARRAVDQHLRNVKGDIDRLINQSFPIIGPNGEGSVMALAVREAGKGIYRLGVVYGTQLSRTCEEVAFNSLSAYLSYAKHSVRAYAGQEETGMRALPAPAV